MKASSISKENVSLVDNLKNNTMKAIGIIVTLCIITSCSPIKNEEIKDIQCEEGNSLFPSDEERFLSDWASKEDFLMDTLFCEFAYVCLRYIDGIIFKSYEKTSPENVCLIIFRSNDKFYLRQERLIDLDSIRSLPENYEISKSIDVKRLSKVEEIFDFIYNYGIYEIRIHHENGFMSIDLGQNGNHENVHLYYRPHEVRYKETHDTMHISYPDCSILDHTIASEGIDSIAPRWSLRKTKEIE